METGNPDILIREFNAGVERLRPFLRASTGILPDAPWREVVHWELQKLHRLLRRLFAFETQNEEGDAAVVHDPDLLAAERILEAQRPQFIRDLAVLWQSTAQGAPRALLVPWITDLLDRLVEHHASENRVALTILAGTDAIAPSPVRSALRAWPLIETGHPATPGELKHV